MDRTEGLRGALCALVALGFLGCVTTGAPPHEPCKNHELEQAMSPEGNIKAVVFERRCGAPMSYTTQVAVISADERLPDRAGNVFVAGNGGRFSRGRSYVTVSWSGPTKLTIAVAHDASVFRIEPNLGPIAVAMVRLDADGATPGTRPAAPAN